MRLALSLFSLLTLCGICSGQAPEAPAPNDLARAFVREHIVVRGEPDLATVHSIVRAVTSRRLFTRIERRRMRQWRERPGTRERWLARFQQLESRSKALVALQSERLLKGDEARELRIAQGHLLSMRRQDAAWRELYSQAAPRDHPFVLTGEDALRLRVIDGCTSAARLFAVLAQAVGLESRFVLGSHLGLLREAWRPGEACAQVLVHGHKMALVRLGERWWLVNTNYYAPELPEPFEIFAELEGEALSPSTLPGKVLRLPSMQVDEAGRSHHLLITGVGARGVLDMGERSLESNLNLSVSGDPKDPTCRNPAVASYFERH